jgi:hypothetical protein
MTRLAFVLIFSALFWNCNRDQFQDEGYVEFTVVGPQVSQTFRIELNGEGGAAACFLPRTADNPETVILTYQETEPQGNEIKLFFPVDGRVHNLADGDFQGMELSIAMPGVELETTATERVVLSVDRIKVRPSPVPCLEEVSTFAVFTGELLGTNAFGEQAVYSIVGECMVQ